MSERTYYVLCDDNCKFESLTKEQILSAIYQGVTSGNIDVADGFITKIKEINHNNDIQFWVGTQAEYNAIEQREENTLYIISDDTSKEEIFADIEEMVQEIEGIQTAITKATADISEINNELNAISSDTSSLETSIAGIEADITTITSNVESLEDDLTALDTVRQQINNGGQLVLHESTGNVFNTALTPISFSLSDIYTNFNKIFVVLNVNPTSAHKVISYEVVYPSIIAGNRFCIKASRYHDDPEAPVIGVFNSNRFDIVQFAQKFDGESFDLRITGIV